MHLSCTHIFHNFTCRSGIEEIYSEKDNLLQGIATICKEFKVILKKKKEKVVSRNQKIINLGKETRDACAKSFYEKKRIWKIILFMILVSTLYYDIQ